MLGKFFRKLARKDPLPEDWKTPGYLAAHYDPSLVRALIHQHRALAVLLVEASSTAQLGAYAEAVSVLEEFESALADHLQQEQTRLHPYLSERLTGEEGERVLREMHTQAALIKQSVAGFLRRYLNTPLDATNVAQFEQDIEAVSEELSQEMEREEAIFYTLYLPPEAY